MELGRFGIWSSPLRRGDESSALTAIREIESLGFRTAWMPGGEAGLGRRVQSLLGAASTLTLAIGIVNIWFHSAAEVLDVHHAAGELGGDRLLSGVGVGHAPLVDREMPGRYQHPIASMSVYLDELDSGPHPIPRAQRIIGALGPRMMRLAGERTAGAHPYLVTPGHTRWAREVMGPDAWLAPELHVVVDRDAGRARALGRQYMAVYLELPNYIANFHRMGFTDADFENGGSDRMIDELVAWGDADTVLARAQEHLDAGADHVALQVLVADRMTFPLDSWKALARAQAVHGSV